MTYAPRGCDDGVAMRTFNTAGPVVAADHYRIPPLERIDLPEAGPQLLLQAFLQRVVNGGGRLEREYALGRGRVDLLIVWPEGGSERRIVVECKVRRGDLERTIAEGWRRRAPTWTGARRPPAT